MKTRLEIMPEEKKIEIAKIVVGNLTLEKAKLVISHDRETKDWVWIMIAGMVELVFGHNLTTIDVIFDHVFRLIKEDLKENGIEY